MVLEFTFYWLLSSLQRMEESAPGYEERIKRKGKGSGTQEKSEVSSSRGSEEELWREYFADPGSFWDN
jgi:hypothetical protein